MITQFSKLHNRVHESFAAAFSLLSFFRPISQQNTSTLHVPEEINEILIKLYKLTN